MTDANTSRATPGLRQAAAYFWRLVRLIRPYWADLSKGMVAALLLGLLGMVTPYITKLLVDRVYPTADVTLMHVLVGATLVFSTAQIVLGGLDSYFSLYVNTRLNNATRLLFFNHLQHLRSRFFDEHQVGEINSRFQDVGRALDAIGRVIQTVFVQGVYLVLVPPMLFYLDWRLALVALITLPLSLGVTAASGPMLRKRWQRSSEAFADLNAFQIETLSHVRTFKTMGLEHLVYERADRLVHHAMEQQLRAGGLTQGFNALNGLLRAVNLAIFTWFGWTLILEGEMTLGDFLAFSAYVTYLFTPVQQLIQLFSDFQQSAVHLDRMFEYLDQPVEVDPATALVPPPPPVVPLRGAYSLRGVRFAYHPEQPVLEDLSLELEAGEVTALVGASGSGKTSLLRLLTGLESPTEGDLRVDRRPLGELPIHELRQQLAVVWQDVALVRGTLRQNLLLGARHGPDDAEIEEILELCGLSGLVRHLPQGLETEVAEWGSTLSAGQRQRVALARAVLRRTPILVLDEATANIDVETEMRILRRLFGRGGGRRDRPRGSRTPADDGAPSAGRSVIFATHRLATAHLADRICVLEHGRVVGFGDHRHLAESCATYRRMLEAAADTGTGGAGSVQGSPGAGR